MNNAIPTNREEAINALVEQDVAKWGEAERDSAVVAHSPRTIGDALNELANRADLDGTPSKALRSAAKAALTKTDRKSLSRGGRD